MRSSSKRVLALLLYVAALSGLAVGYALSLGAESSANGAAGFSFVLILLSYATVGLAVALRTGHRIGWLFLGSSVLGSAWAAAGSYGQRALVEDLPGLEWAVWFQGAIYFSWLISAVSLPLLLFPDGRAPSRRWRWVVRAVVLLAVYAAITSTVTSRYILEPEDTGLEVDVFVDNPFGFGLIDPSDSPVEVVVVGLLIAGALILPAWAILWRFRRSHGVERQQIKWFAFAAGVAGSGLAFFFLAQSLPEPPPWVELALLPALLAVAGLPVAAGLAVVRYRLYDIDRLISRTISYGLLAGLLAAVYALAVFVLGTILPLQDNSVIVATSTLAVAALFNPLRRRVKSAIERRFFRPGYDPEVVADRFARSIRDGVDVESLSAELLDVVQETMQPSGASVWLRTDGAAAERARRRHDAHTEPDPVRSDNS